MEKLIKKDYNKIISLAICLQLTIMGMKNAIIQGVPFLYNHNGVLNIILFVMIGMVYFITVISCRRKFAKSGRYSLFVLFFVLASFAWTIIIFPQNIPSIISMLPRTIPFCFLTAYFLCRLSDLYWIQFYMCKFAYFLTFSTAVAALYIYRTGSTINGNDYSMPLSYVTLVGAMWHLYDFFNNRKKRAALFAVFDIIVIFAYGARNPLLAICIYILIKFIGSIKNKDLKYNIRCFYLILNALICLILLFLKPLSSFLIQILSKLNITSRTIHMILYGYFFSFSGRTWIHQQLFSILNQHPIMGIGIAGDVATINETAHSLFISLFVSYGYVLGGVIIMTLGIMILKTLNISFGVEHKVLVLYICMVLPRAFTGGDVWDSDVFWWLLGIMLSIVENKYAMYRKPYFQKVKILRENYDENIACN